MRKIKYLNRTIMWIILVGYTALLFLLLCTDFYLMMEQNRANRSREAGALSDYVQTLSEEIEKNRLLLYDIHRENENYRALSGSLSDVEKYSNAYELCQTLESQLLIDSDFQGFYLFYDEDTMPMYRLNTERILPDHASKIAEILRNIQKSQNTVKIQRWFPLKVEESVYFALACTQGNVTLYGICEIDAQTAISEGSGREAEIVLWSDGRCLSGEELSDSLEIGQEAERSREQFFYQKNRYSVYGERVENLSLWVCPVFPKSPWDYISVLQLCLLLLTIVSVIAVITLMRFVRRNFVKPLRQLCTEMENIHNGTRENIPDMNFRFFELRRVTETMQEMITKLEKQRLLTYEALIEKQKAQLQYLQLQLQPHFYLNGLKTINALALNHQTDRVQKLILNLSAHLRYLMEAEKETTILEKELDFVSNYVELQAQVTGRKIRLEVEVEPEVRRFKVPMLVVETFAENSVKYVRLGDTDAVLELNVQAGLLVTDQGNYLDLLISDNGQGYPEELLKELEGEPKIGEKHVGIHNLRRRCRILYGDRAEFSFYNSQGAVSECILPEEGPE